MKRSVKIPSPRHTMESISTVACDSVDTSVAAHEDLNLEDLKVSPIPGRTIDGEGHSREPTASCQLQTRLSSYAMSIACQRNNAGLVRERRNIGIFRPGAFEAL